MSESNQAKASRIKLLSLVRTVLVALATDTVISSEGPEGIVGCDARETPMSV
jgi:hypothetical protein